LLLFALLADWMSFLFPVAAIAHLLPIVHGRETDRAISEIPCYTMTEDCPTSQTTRSRSEAPTTGSLLRRDTIAREIQNEYIME
jgi:hypothetical protein